MFGLFSFVSISIRNIGICVSRGNVFAWHWKYIGLCFLHYQCDWWFIHFVPFDGEGLPRKANIRHVRPMKTVKAKYVPRKASCVIGGFVVWGDYVCLEMRVYAVEGNLVIVWGWYGCRERRVYTVKWVCAMGCKYVLSKVFFAVRALCLMRRLYFPWKAYLFPVKGYLP